MVGVQILARKLWIPGFYPSSVLVCSICTLGFFITFRLLSYGSLGLHTLLRSPMVLGIMNVTEQMFINVVILKSCMLSQGLPGSKASLGNTFY